MNRPLADEIRATTRLAAPIVLSQLGVIAMGTVDIVMIGRYSADALAAAALGHIYHWAICVFAFGVLTVVEPIVAQAIGAGDHDAARRGLQRGLAVAVLLAIPAMLLSLPAAAVFTAFDQPPEIVPDAAAYVRYSLPGILPFLLFTHFRLSLQAFSVTRPIVITVLAANVLNLAANWVLIYGNLGCPELGVRGSAIATVIARTAMAGGLLAIGWPRLRRYLMVWDRETWRVRPIAKVIALGLPIGAQFVVEMAAFGCTGLLMGQFGSAEVGGHQIAINLASISFMFPVGLSGAAAVRVGYAVGANDALGIRRAAAIALVGGGAMMLLFAVLFLVWPHALAQLYTPHRAPMVVAAALVPLAGLFQVFDGVQVVAVGVLRGLGDTKTPLFVNVLGFWAIGIPAGAGLAFTADQGPRGLWWGLAIGLAVVAVILTLRIRWRIRRHVGRLTVE